GGVSEWESEAAQEQNDRRTARRHSTPSPVSHCQPFHGLVITAFIRSWSGETFSPGILTSIAISDRSLQELRPVQRRSRSQRLQARLGQFPGWTEHQNG